MKTILYTLGLERMHYLKQLLQFFRIFLQYFSFGKLGNLIRCEWALIRKKPVVQSMPYLLKIEATNRCNLKCRFCPRRQMTNARGTISFKNFITIFDQFKDNLILFSPHLWGEPLLNPNVCRMIRYAHDNGVGTYMSTNMHYLDTAFCEKLITSGLDLLTVSLDGASPETYRTYRKNGDFDLVIQNVEALIRKKRESGSRTPLVQIQFIVFRHNEHEIERIHTGQAPGRRRCQSQTRGHRGPQLVAEQRQAEIQSICNRQKEDENLLVALANRHSELEWPGIPLLP